MLLVGHNRVDSSRRRPRNGLSCSTPVCLVAGGSSPLRHLFHRPDCFLAHLCTSPALATAPPSCVKPAVIPKMARVQRRPQSQCPAWVDGADPDPARPGTARKRATPTASPGTAACAHRRRRPAPITMIAPLRESSAAAQRGSRVGMQRRSPRAYNVPFRRFACQSPNRVRRRCFQENVNLL